MRIASTEQAAYGDRMTNTPQATAADWHGGQSSPFYSFASTGVLHFPASRYRHEAAECFKDTYLQTREAQQRGVDTAHWHDPDVKKWVEDELESAIANRIDLRRLWRYIVANAPAEPEEED